MDYRDDYQPGARRFDVGQRTKFELVPMAIAALEQLTEWGVDARRRRGSPRSPATIAERTSRAGARRRWRPRSAARTCSAWPCPTASATPCCPALAKADCYAALRGRALRISPHLHVTERDVDRLVEALRDATAG